MLNLGSGPEAVAGWINIDRSPSLLLDRLPACKLLLHRAGILAEGQMVSWARQIRLINITKGLPFNTDSVFAVYSSHTLEHLYLDDAAKVLKECYRVLMPQSILRVALPDGEQWARDLIAGLADDGDCPGLTYNARLGAYSPKRPTGVRKVTASASGSAHRWQPTRDLVKSLFSGAGFANVVQRSYREGHLPQLDQVETRPESIFFEASA